MKKFFSLLIIFSLFSPVVSLAQSPFGDPPQNPQDPGTATGVGPTSSIDNPTNPGAPGSLGPTAPIDNPTNPGSITGAGTGIDAGTGISAGNATPATGNGLIPEPTDPGLVIIGGKPTDPGFVLGAGRPTNPGYVLYAGGGNSMNFWDYLKGLLSLDGQDNQSTYKNQESSVIESTDNITPYTVGTTPKTFIKKDTSSKAFCTRDTSTKTVNGYINLATCIVLVLIPIIISALVLWFMFGSVRVLGDNESEKRNDYKQFLAWGLLIIFVALSFVGILRVLSKTLGI